MAKKRKKNRKTIKTQPKNLECLVAEQKLALLELRGRRASRLGEQIFEDLSLIEELRVKALAVGYEAYLRELIARGHEDQARNRANKLLLNTPELKKYWALSLQLRWNLSQTHTDDKNWMVRLRSELVDPSDLLQLDVVGITEEAKTLIQAWEQIEEGRVSEALLGLKTIGRRSPLVDWRLFLQILIELHKGNPTGLESYVNRIQKGSPAHQLALKAMGVDKSDNKGPVFKRLRALEARLIKEELPVGEYPKLQQELLWLLKENRPGLAITLASSIGAKLVEARERGIQQDYNINLMQNLLIKCSSRLFSTTRIFLRLVYDEDPAILFESDSLDDIVAESWSNAELACVWPEVFHQVTLEWLEIEKHNPQEDWEYIYDDFIDPLVKTCEKLTKRIPQCRELYEFWLWALNKRSFSQHPALVAYANAFPNDRDVLKRTALGLAAEGADKSHDLVFSRLKKLYPAEQFENMEQTLLITKLRLAFRNKNLPEVHELAAAYSGSDLLEQIEVAFVLWRLSFRGKKAKLGAKLNDFKLPWLVFYVGCRLDPAFRERMLPAALKRSLSKDPDAVLLGLRKLIEVDESKVIGLMDMHLLDPIIHAAEHPKASIEPLRHLLPILLLRFEAADDLVWRSTSGFIRPFRTLLSGELNDQALAIGLRLMIPQLANYSIDKERSQQSFQVAWTLANEATRKIIYQVHNKCGFSQGQFPKETATPKMIAAELKMQGKFSDEDQIIRWYSLEEPIGKSQLKDIKDAVETLKNDFENMSPEEIQKAIMEMMNRAGFDTNDPLLDQEEDDDWEDPEDWGEPNEPLRSKPYIFSPHAPTMELEFDKIIKNVRETTQQQHRLDATDRLKEMCQQSRLSDNAKARLLIKIEQLRKDT